MEDVQDKKNVNTIWVVIPASGRGQRFGSEKPKQYQKLIDKTILEHSVAVMIETVLPENFILNKCIIVIADNDSDFSQLPIGKLQLIETTVGGLTRAESVLKGLYHIQELAKPDDWVLVHDAARPLLSKTALLSLINFCINNPEFSGAILCEKISDTLKLSQKLNSTTLSISKTIDRNHIYAAQTPQMFRYEELREALINGLKSYPESITDEASAIELQGGQVGLVINETPNFKITTSNDFLLASHFLQTDKNNKEMSKCH